MPTSYTSLLGLALPVQGELSGVWGDTVNDYITKYVDASVAGTQIISGSQTAVTLSTTTGSTLSQVGAGATGSAQYMVINCTGNPAGMLTITAPAVSKTYLVINATSTAQSVKLVGVGPTTGVTLLSGERAVVAWNGSDFVKLASTELFVSPSTSGNVLTSNGTTWTSSPPLIPQSGAAKVTNYTLTTADAGKIVEVGTGGSITVPDSVFSAGNVVSIFNNTTGNITITCSITTAYRGGVDADQASVTLRTRGVAAILFISGTVCVINGNLV